MTSLSQVSNQELIQELKNRIRRRQTPKKTNKIISLEIQKEKLIARLDDGREVIFPISLLTQLEILNPEIKPEQLKKIWVMRRRASCFFSGHWWSIADLDNLPRAKFLLIGFYEPNLF